MSNLYEFIETKEIEWRNELLVMWIEPENLKELTEILGDAFLGENGLTMVLMPGGTIAIELNDIADHYGINLDTILDRE